MAEGWTRALKSDTITAYSAGTEMHGLNPHAVKVMAECGVDISGHTSKQVDELLSIEMDYVVTVCGHAHENCPLFPGHATVHHVGFDDPPACARELAERGADEEAQLDCYRRVRDEIREFVDGLPQRLQKKGAER